MELVRFDSKIEQELFQAFQNYGVTPRVQYKILYFRVDMAFPEIKLAIECDGHKYHTGDYNWDRDRRRQRFLEARGWKFERFQGWLIRRYADACASKVLLRYLPHKLSERDKERCISAMEVFYLRSA